MLEEWKGSRFVVQLLLIVSSLLCSFLSGASLPRLAVTPVNHKTQNVLFVMTDGLRWQEVFRGADPALLHQKGGETTDVELLKRTYWRESPEERRRVLMPFLWEVIGRAGQIYGNRDKGSDAFVTNGHNFSYPGYSETLCGFPDPRINSNDKIPNPNVTVLEWLEKKPAYHGRIAVFGAWELFPWIFHASRAGFLVNAGYEPLNVLPGSTRVDLLNHLKAETPRIWGEEPFDALPFYTALEYLQARQPKVFYLSFGETDEWAHAGNYAEYLNAAHRVDDYLKTLWNTVQSLPAYRNTTTLLFSPDHGRGEAPTNWKSHGEKLPESKYIWMAFLGPDTAALGERTRHPAVTQSQIASTLAALLGEDYAADIPHSGQPLFDVLPH